MNRFSLFLTGLLLFSMFVKAQQPDSTHIADTGSVKKDTTQLVIPVDTPVQAVFSIPEFKLSNRFVNTKDAPVSLSVEFRKEKNTDSLFYLITGIVLLLAFFRYFYNRYFLNLFRVFFNTSLRQSQLTDQLLQAKLPSLLFNFFFVISGGMYAYILLLYYGLINEDNRWLMIGASVAVLGITYLVKYTTLKFTGWITGLKDITNTYVFVIFLINKIIGIFLVPFIVILTFSDPVIIKIGVIVSLLSIGLFLLLRFFRSYGLLQNQLKISRFHFVLYIAGIEIIPLLLIYKGLMLYLSKNL
ncbi:MAG: DUF4271 domain-containing protein [Chitinophagaceae bacterium]|nr:DUF4271 domain-containing protein [Chitinophagaceae bacterium]